jgi:hypothetical protein
VEACLVMLQLSTQPGHHASLDTHASEWNQQWNGLPESYCAACAGVCCLHLGAALRLDGLQLHTDIVGAPALSMLVVLLAAHMAQLYCCAVLVRRVGVLGW